MPRPPLRTIRWALAGGALRVGALIAAATFGSVCCSAAQDTPAPAALHIAVSDSGRSILDGLVPDITMVAGLAVPPVVTYSDAPSTLRAFCQGVGGSSPDIVLTVNRLRPALTGECVKNGVEHMVRVELGRGVLVLAVRTGSSLTELTARQVYLALARDVPDGDQFRRNTAIRWSDIDRALPPMDIRFQLPPRVSGNRVLFNALVMEGGCRTEPLVQNIFKATERIARCATTRVDRVREIPQDLAVRELLNAPEGTVGVLPYLDVVQSGGQFVGVALDGVAPTHDAIVQGTYKFANPYWLYAKRGQALRGRDPAVDAAVDRVIAHTVTEPVIGPDGILSRLGLIPLPGEDRDAQRAIFTVQSSSFGIMPVIDWLADATDATGSLLGYVLGGSASTARSGDADFTSLMDLAGYKNKQFDTSVGIIPDASMTFGIVREMSEADKDYLERTLSLDAHNRTGAIPAIQRKIVRSVLELGESEGYEINQVDIELLPLPSVRLTLQPTAASAVTSNTAAPGLSDSQLSQASP
jgi:phosphate transport system substrate-binding protein